MFSFLLGVCLRIQLLMLTLYLTSWETATLLSKVAAPFYLPNIHVWGLGFFAPGLPKGRSLVSTLVPRAWPGTTQGLSAGKAPWPPGLSLTSSFSLSSPLLLFSRSSARSFQLSGKMPEELTRCQEAALFWKVLLLGSACRQEPPIFDGGHSAAGWGR